MLFSEIIGQQNVKAKLTSSVNSGRIAHAQLFSGPEGSGTLPMAIAYAQFVACTGPKQTDSCGECVSCRKFNKLAHPDLHFSYPVNTTKKLKEPSSDDFIHEWREFVLTNPYFRANAWYNYIGLENKQGLISKKEGEAILRKLSLKPFESDYKFMIIWLPEKMHSKVSNMLLKFIEEPPSGTLFLLVSELPEQLLPTIFSRTQPIRMEALQTDDVKEAIGGLYDMDAAALEDLARLSNGNYIKALEMVRESGENTYYLEKFMECMRLCWKADYVGANDWVEELGALGRERQKGYFEYAVRLLRENFIMNLQKPDLVYQTAGEAEFANKFHPFINGRNIMSLYEEMNKASADIERNGNARIILFDLCLVIMKLIRK